MTGCPARMVVPGLGISAHLTDGLQPKERLEQFVEKHFPKASVLACVAGGVPAAKPFKRIHGPGFMLAGDAAAQANPLTGGGITNAMAAGKLAGETAARCIQRGRWLQEDLEDYSRRWEANWGEEQRRLYRIKEAVHRIKDETFNQAARILVKIPVQKRTLQKVFTVTLSRHPKVLLDIARCFLES